MNASDVEQSSLRKFRNDNEQFNCEIEHLHKVKADCLTSEAFIWGWIRHNFILYQLVTLHAGDPFEMDNTARRVLWDAATVTVNYADTG